MIVIEQLMCFNNSICQTSLSIMNNSSSLSSSPLPPPPRHLPFSSSSSNSADKNSYHDSEHESHDEKTTNQILDVIFDYMANGDDELTLRRGSKLEVLSTDESISGSRGWWTGRLVDSNSVGIFPANFVADSASKLRIIDYNDLHIGETIGVGGFGHVYHGKFGDVDVAIKTAKSLASFCSIQITSQKSHGGGSGDHDRSDAMQQSLIEGLLREARLFSHLKHRNIIQLLGVSPSLSTRNLYLVMEYAHGGALSYLLQQRQSGLYPTVFIEYAKQIADGMNYLHEEACEQRIIHRDLKCSNILILEPINDIHDDQDLSTKTLKITDFGLARKQIQSSSTSAAGTFAWMSPECIRNNEFSTKSDVWSFGVLLWECLTGELPYHGFDQMQVAFGVATNKYTLPIPSTCPDEFAQLMKNCWKLYPRERPTFAELLTQINAMIPLDIHPNECHDESYQSLQQDWRQEIQDMFEELKEKEKEIRDREQAIIQVSLEQNHQRLQLQQWEQQLLEREKYLVECELKLLMSAINQERVQHQTPKIQKRSGRFMRSFLNGANPSQSPSQTNFISSPTNFRHLISVCHNHPSVEHPITSTLPNSSTNSSNLFGSNSPIKSTNVPHQDSFSSNSTPTTPNLSRLRTLTFHFPVQTDGSNPSTPPEKPPRSHSSSKASPTPRFHSRKSKSSSSSTLKKKYSKTNFSNGEAKWYLDTMPINSNNNNNNDTPTFSSTKSTPILDRPTKKLGSSSSCSTPNERSLSRALFDINSMLSSIGLGRCLPVSFHSSNSHTSSEHHQSPPTDFVHKEKSFSSSSATTTPSPSSSTHPSCGHRQRLSSSRLTVDSVDAATSNYRSRPYSSPVRPNSLVLSSSKGDSSHRHSLQHDVDEDEPERYYSAQSSRLSTPLIHSIGSASRSDDERNKYHRNSMEK